MSDPRTAYRINEGQGVSPVRSVILLYQQVIEDIRLASQAIDRKDVESRTRAINHAILILGHLQAHLRVEPGQTTADHLRRFYELVRGKLVEAQCTVSKEILQEQVSALLAVRDVWKRVELAEAARPLVVASTNSRTR